MILTPQRAAAGLTNVWAGVGAVDSATRSIVLAGDSRYVWKHGIAKRKFDNIHGHKIRRARRVALTFRIMKPYY